MLILLIYFYHSLPDEVFMGGFILQGSESAAFKDCFHCNTYV